MWTGELTAYILSSTSRREVRRDTIASLAATDWNAEPVVIIDQLRTPNLGRRALDNTRSLLLRAVSGPGDLFLFLEDDVDFNRWLRFNVEHWPPLLERPIGGDFYASLYNPNVEPLSPDLDGDTFWIANPEAIYGAQGVLMSTSTAAYILRHWDEVIGFQDIRMSRLAARRTQIYYHRPSLVQHRAVPSMWGGEPHHACDFSPDWRAG